MKQDCIPVGCVPPAYCPYLPACTAQGVSAPRECLLQGCLFWGMSAPGEEYLLQGVCGGGIPACTAQHRAPPVNRMTDRCKNITLPQTSFGGGNTTGCQFSKIRKHHLAIKLYLRLLHSLVVFDR